MAKKMNFWEIEEEEEEIFPRESIEAKQEIKPKQIENRETLIKELNNKSSKPKKAKKKKPPVKKKPKSQNELKEEFKAKAKKLKTPKIDKDNSKVIVINQIIKVLNDNKQRNSPIALDFLRGIKLQLELAEQKVIIKKLQALSRQIDIKH